LLPVQAAPTPTVAPVADTTGKPLWDRVPERWLHYTVVLVCLAIYLPLCGSYGFWDPWEGHYAEVARQMSVRGDWISLWWPGSQLDRAEFWSKPVFTFWIEAVMFRLFGLAKAGGPAGQMALSSAAEWACRIPMALLGTLGVWGIFHATSRLVSRRAGLLAALVCATSPLYFLIARQAITDMPFVGPMTAALCLGALALLDEDAELPRRQLRWFTIPQTPLFYVFAAVFALLALPQLIYNSIWLRIAIPLGTHRLYMPGVVAMLPYMGLFGWFGWRIRRARWRSQVQLQLAYTLCGVAALAKGLVGIGLPGMVLVLFLAVTWDWKQLRRLDIGNGILNIVVIAFPWYHAMLIRHGMPFWSELFGDNHWRRLAIGRHGDNTGQFNYYLRELGYALMPWTAIAAAAVPTALLRARPTSQKGKFLLYAGLWALAGYALVTASMTKFHHYILPALPAIAILCGWFLDALLDGEIAIGPATAALCLFGLPLMALAVWDVTATPQAAQRFLWLFDYDYINSARGRTWPEQLRYGGFILGFAIVAAGATVLMCSARARKWAVVGLGAVAVVWSFFMLDKFILELSPHWSQKHLFATYYQMRAPGDRIVAWQMYWRGETFYCENEIYDPKLSKEEKTVFLGERNAENMQDWLKHHPGTRVFFIVERTRMPTLQTMMPTQSGKQSLHVVDETNNKFVLAVANI
jgi:4-amino-4-deoxy-L-arabinose transferase-like glycosyltransferase